MSRSFHLASPGWTGDVDDFHEAVVAALLNGPRYMKVALELWQLVGRDDRVREIRDLLEVAHNRELPILHAEEVKELDRLLDELDTAVKTTLSLDEGWRVPEERMAYVRSQASLLHVNDTDSHNGADGVADGLSEVHALRGFLQQALERGLDLVLD